MLELIASTRLQILIKLKERPYTASELSKILGLSKTAASYHLDKLASSGLVERIERGKWVYYKITNRGLKDMQIRLLASIIFLCSSILSAIVLIARLFQRIPEVTMPQISKEVRPAALPTSPDYYVLEITGIALITMTSIILFLYLRR
ncbi:MAG: winged helix-turn-helix domain-containing protein [Archaeoglobaceae archaeon]